MGSCWSSNGKVQKTRIDPKNSKQGNTWFNHNIKGVKKLALPLTQLPNLDYKEYTRPVSKFENQNINRGKHDA